MVAQSDLLFKQHSMTDKKEREMKQDIAAQLRKKDYYDILGVSKSASEGQIKKAYRTLALRFHPDKNQFEGSKEVFKKVSNAYSILSDTQKRQHYDRFGVQQERPRRQYQYAGAQGQDFEYDQYNDIFNAFFGMQGQQRGGHQHFRTYTFGGPQHRQNGQQQQSGFSFFYIFIIFFVIYTIAPFFQSKPNYSTTPSSVYRFRKTTPILNVEFYVTQKYFEQAKNLEFKRQSEMIIDRQYISVLESTCQLSKKQKRRIEEYAYREYPGPRRQSYLAQARSVDLAACRRINDIRIRNDDYIRDLTYMR